LVNGNVAQTDNVQPCDVGLTRPKFCRQPGGRFADEVICASKSNSTSTSTPLSGLKSSRKTEPNSASQRMWLRQQKSANCSRGTVI
jgi:hypothetical protein